MLFMQSDGGLTPMNRCRQTVCMFVCMFVCLFVCLCFIASLLSRFIGSRAVLSGPAGGVVSIFIVY